VEDAFFVDAGLTYDSPVNISGITQADPGVVTTSNSHGLSADEIVGISDVEGMTDLNRNQYVVKNPTSTTFELYDKDGNSIDTTEFDAYTGGGEVRLAIDTFGGLSHLEGRDVTILADGNVLPAKTVSDGQITLDRKYSRIHVGLPYESIIETRGVDADSLQSIGRKGSVKMLKMRILKSRGYEVGPDRDNTKPIKERQFEALGDPISLQSGIKKHTVQAKIKEDPKFAIKQANPLPLEILSAVVEVQFEGEG
jgi:hypothetical protein